MAVKQAEIKGDNYLLVIGLDDGEYWCYGCDSEQDACQILAEWVRNELDGLILDDVSQDIQDLAYMIQESGNITNPYIAYEAFSSFMANCWWFNLLETSRGHSVKRWAGNERR